MTLAAFGQDEFLVVELAVEHPQVLVVEPAGVAPAQQLLALGVDHRLPDHQRRLILRRRRQLR